MCGIAGWAGGVAANDRVLNQMCTAIRHRGPDDEGFLLVPGKVALGFRRLSIIDLQTGNQPLFDEARNVSVICNGEIYNFRELRRDLEVRGHRFRTNSDVEVIPHLYEEHGPDFVDALQGMFAIAVWDAENDRLVLTRDRIGVKPLFYAEVTNGLVFGSEPAAILASGVVSRRVDPVAIMQYLTLQYVPPPLTGFSDIRKLGAGERLVYERGDISVKRYWSLPRPDPKAASLRDEEALTELDTLMRDATAGRLISDVPLGAFLSGGIDSSLVVSYMAEQTQQVKTFSIDVPEAAWSETEHARTVSSLFGADHHVFLVEPDMVPTVAEAIRYVGEPFADSSAIPTYLLSRLTRSKVTVALSGDGGDEAFGGYQRYRRVLQLERFTPVARVPARIVEAIVPARVMTRMPTIDRRLRLLGQSPHDRYASMVSHFAPWHLDRLCRPEFVEAAGGTRTAWDRLLALPSLDDINRYTFLDTTTYLPGDILVKVDRMSMAHALEVRSPLLDYRVQEFAARLPGTLKIRGAQTKWLLRTLALRRGIPDQTVNRPKMGFSIPVGLWLRGKLRDWIFDLVQSRQALDRGYFREREVARLLDEHMSGAAEHEPRLWNLAMLELWHRAWVDTS